MESTSLAQAISRLVLIDEQAGFSVEDLIQMLNAGVA